MLFTQRCPLDATVDVGKVLNSLKWLNKLKHRVVEAKGQGEAIKMTVQRAVILVKLSGIKL